MTRPAAIRVDRCVCLGRTFADLLHQADAEALDVDKLMALPSPKGRRCGLCKPYVRECLRTGQTVFHELLPPDPA